MKDIKRLLGMRLKELRKNRGLSQEGLAEKVAISAKYLSRVEMGRHVPSLNVLLRLAVVLRVEIKDMFEFFHEAPGQRELKEMLVNLIKEADDEKLRLLVKLVRAVVK